MADEILSYKDKYMSGGGSKGGAKGGAKDSGGAKGGMASLKRKVPADLDPEMRERIRTMAVDAFQHLGCNGVSRIDFMIDNATGELFINEFPDKDKKYPAKAFYVWHNRLTGSCEMGRKSFIKNGGYDLENDAFTVAEFIDITRDAYGGEVIEQLEEALKGR